MSQTLGPPDRFALVLVDLQNDFLHPDGAYGRAGQSSAAIAALPERLRPLVAATRAAGGWVIATQFTLVPGRRGEPLIAAHLRALRPFLTRGDFAPGSWGQALVETLAPADLLVEKIAYSAFYMSRMDFLLRKTGIETLAFAGIVTNGGVAATLRDAHIREFSPILLEDGCADFSPAAHQAAIASLAGISRVMRIADLIEQLGPPA